MKQGNKLKKHINRSVILVLCVCMSLIVFTGCGDKTSVPETSKEISDAELYSGMIQIGDTVLQMPCTVLELAETGANFTDGKHSGSYQVDASGIKLDMQIDDTTFTAWAFPETTSSQDLASCVISDIYNITGDDVILPGGVKRGSKVKDVEKIYGNETSESLKESSSSSLFGDKSSGDLNTFVWYQYPSLPIADEDNINDEKYISLSNNEVLLDIDRDSGLVAKMSVTANEQLNFNDREKVPIGEMTVKKYSIQIPAVFTTARCEYIKNSRNLSDDELLYGSRFFTTTIDNRPYAFAYNIEDKSGTDIKELLGEKDSSINSVFEDVETYPVHDISTASTPALYQDIWDEDKTTGTYSLLIQQGSFAAMVTMTVVSVDGNPPSDMALSRIVDELYQVKDSLTEESGGN